MEHYITALSESVVRERVTFQNRFGIELSADLYTPKEHEGRLPALVVGPPYGGVKEQGPCVWANGLAERGFVVLAFDQPFMGTSGGTVRNVASPELFTESFSASVDYLGLLPYVDREKIGAVGICGSGGFALSAAQCDVRIRALVTASMYDISYAVRMGQTREQLEEHKKQLSMKRWEDAEKGTPECILSYPETPLEEIPKGIPEPAAEFMRFYAMKRGHHPNARGGFTTTSDLSFMNFRLLDYIGEISPRPILFIVGDRAHSRFFSDIAYKNANQPKEMYVVEDAEHIDLYDRTDKIPFDYVAKFFTDNLK